MSADDVRKLHSKFGIYDSCGHEHTDEECEKEGSGVVYVEDVGLTCEEGLVQWVCRECDTVDCEPDEYTCEGKWPCATLIALEKP